MHPSIPHARAFRRRGVVLLAAVFIVPVFLLAVVQAFLQVPPLPEARDVMWGVTFSQKMCARLGVDWRLAYADVLHDLRPSAVRLVAYWDLVEPKPGAYDFRDLDYQVDQAEANGIPVVIVVGQKVPRWPEYHFPRWLDVRDTAEREQRLLAYERAVVERYRARRVVRYWQVENEPFLAFGIGPGPDAALFAREVALVRSLDPAHPVLVTDGGEYGGWTATAREGDVFGTTLYRTVYDPRLGEYTYPVTPQFYAVRVALTKALTRKPDQRFICAELGAEPWGDRPIQQMTLDEQARLFPRGRLVSIVAFARETRFTEFYFWGVEWWYYRKQTGDAAYWDEARRVIRGGERPAVRPAGPAFR